MNHHSHVSYFGGRVEGEVFFDVLYDLTISYKLLSFVHHLHSGFGVNDEDFLGGNSCMQIGNRIPLSIP